MQCLQQFGDVEADFLNPSVSDHSPILIKCRQHHNIHPRVFRFYTNVMEHPNFAATLNKAWGESTRECTMKQIWKKLKKFKDQSKGMNAYMASYKQKLNVLREQLDILQTNLQTSNLDQSIIEQEKKILIDF